MEIIRFLKTKLRNMDIKTILLMEIEGWLFFIFGSVPGMLGFILRNACLFSRKAGFVWLQPRITIVHSKRLSFGKNCGINSGTYINGLGGIEFGNNILIGSNVTISSGMHPIDGRGVSVTERPSVPKKIIFEDDVWIGAGAVIMPGIILRKGTVVGANSIVTKSTEEYGVYVGSPAKKIKER